MDSRPHTDDSLPGIARRGDGVVVEAAGDIDIASQHELSALLARVLETGVAALVVDVSRVTLLSAAGVHCLERAAHQSAARGTSMHIACPPDSMTSRILRLRAGDGAWLAHPDVAAAVAAATRHVPRPSALS